MVVQSKAFEDLMIPTYITNLKHNSDYLSYALNQFENKPEFDLQVVEACEHHISAIGLWKTIVKIINMAIQNEDDVIIICKDDHEFTNHYSKEYLLQNIIDANDQGCTILSGGISSFGHVVPITEHRMWVNPFQSTQFIVLYKSIFKKILNYNFKREDNVDLVLSQLTSHKMILYPFISQRKDLGTAGVIAIPNELSDLEQKTKDRLQAIQNAYLKYLSK